MITKIVSRGKTVEVSPELHKRLKLIATLEGKRLSDITAEMLKKQLAENDQLRNLNPVSVNM